MAMEIQATTVKDITNIQRHWEKLIENHQKQIDNGAINEDTIAAFIKIIQETSQGIAMAPHQDRPQLLLHMSAVTQIINFQLSEINETFANQIPFPFFTTLAEGVDILTRGLQNKETENFSYNFFVKIDQMLKVCAQQQGHVSLKWLKQINAVKDIKASIKEIRSKLSWRDLFNENHPKVKIIGMLQSIADTIKASN